MRVARKAPNSSSSASSEAGTHRHSAVSHEWPTGGSKRSVTSRTMVVYDQPPGATCVEPQSGPPDGFNSPDPFAAAHLLPGEHLTRWMRVRFEM